MSHSTKPIKHQTVQQLRDEEVRKMLALRQMRTESATPKFGRHQSGPRQPLRLADLIDAGSAADTASPSPVRR